jgi:tRNA threonylcarbamoyladenosine biosynthesis protein TsaB
VEAAGGWKEVTAIAVGLGPGSFTGLRVGIASARALATTTGLPLLGVGTLDALGRGLGETDGEEGPRLAVLDARRGEAFAALYSASGGRLWGPWVGAPEELGERVAVMPEPPLAGGSGALRFRRELTARGARVPDDADAVHRVAARHLCALAEAGAGSEGESLTPIYMRVPDAERWRERDTSQRAE